MKFLIIGDLHGNVPKIYYKDFDAIIAPGDFCSDAPRKYMFQALREHLKDKDSDASWYGIVGKKRASKMIKKSLSDGRKILKGLNSLKAPVYTVPGNWDWTPSKKSDWSVLKKNHWENLVKGLRNVKDVYHKLVDVGDFQIIGHGISSGPEYPQHKEDLDRFTKKELKRMKSSYKKLYNKVDKLFKKAKKKNKPIIFISHNVPFNTRIDKINWKESPRDGQHMGSLIAREMIDKHQPLVCIGGHMHEHFGKCKVGKTTAINAGFGSYVNVMLELNGKRIKKLEFHKGK